VPAHEGERGGLLEFHARLFSRTRHKAKGWERCPGLFAVSELRQYSAVQAFCGRLRRLCRPCVRAKLFESHRPDKCRSDPRALCHCT
jgi:hypothetical protein